MGLLGTSFIIQEFVSPRIWETWKENSIWFINPDMILFAQWLKEQTGSTVTINDWAFGGGYQFSGLRPFDCKTGAKMSQHRFGNAIDIKVEGWDAEDLRNLIRENWKFLHDKFGLTTMEKDTPTWLHVDFRYTGLNYLFEINYK